MTAQRFVEDWRGRGLTERESAQAHFIQLCRLLDVAAPYDNRAEDENYCFDAITATAGSHEYAAAKRAGAKGERGKKRGAGEIGLWGQEEVAPAGEGGVDAGGDGDAGGAPVTKIVPAAEKEHRFADVRRSSRGLPSRFATERSRTAGRSGRCIQHPRGAEIAVVENSPHLRPDV